MINEVLKHGSYILNGDVYTTLTVENEKGEKIVEITDCELITSNGYVVRLTPRYNPIFEGMTFKGEPVTFDVYADNYNDYVKRCEG